jgi:hypothetical protein
MDLLTWTAKLLGGYLGIPTAPGLGADLNREVVETHPYHSEPDSSLWDDDWHIRRTQATGGVASTVRAKIYPRKPVGKGIAKRTRARKFAQHRAWKSGGAILLPEFRDSLHNHADGSSGEIVYADEA